MALENPSKALKYYIAYKNRITRLSELLGVETSEIQRYASELTGKSELFFIVKQAAQKHKLGDLSGAASLLKVPVQYIATRVLKPNYIVETGVGIGISSLFYLEALNMNRKGELYSIDLPRQSYHVPQGIHTDYLPNEMEPGWLVPEKLRERWHLHLGDSKIELPKLLADLGTIDIFMHDSEHTYDFMMFEFETTWKHLKKGGILLSDDISWNKSFEDFAKKVNSNIVSFAAFGGIRKG
jgi:predicted O-methyltransferase YrrM